MRIGSRVAIHWLKNTWPGLRRKYELTHRKPERYWRFDRWWIILGSLAFPALVVVFYLMVFKPY